MKNKYIDVNHPTVKALVSQLTADKKNEIEKLEAIFNYVRDDIEFAFLKRADLMSASEVLLARKGQCNNKSILFHALCKGAGIKSRIHYSTIRKEIHHGLFKGILFMLMPKEISHSWIEVNINGNWISIDNFINDLAFYNGGKAKLKKEGRDTGYSVSCAGGESSPNLDLDGSKFVQMGAVVEDQGIYDNPEEYFNSSKYKNNPSALKMLIYRLHLKGINRRIDSIRKQKYTT